MDCLPMDSVCSMQNFYNNQIQLMVIEDKAKESQVILGTFNEKTYILSIFDGEYIIAAFSKIKASPPEMF